MPSRIKHSVSGRSGGMSDITKELTKLKHKVGQTNSVTYVLVTAARNEAEFIELTIKSVVAQTVRPLKWVIVSDGSTDGTDEIVKAYARDYAWIELVTMPARRERHFAGEAFAFHAGRHRVEA